MADGVKMKEEERGKEEERKATGERKEGRNCKKLSSFLLSLHAVVQEAFPSEISFVHIPGFQILFSHSLNFLRIEELKNRKNHE